MLYFLLFVCTTFILVQSTSQIFAVIGGTQCTENLNYGPQEISINGSADGAYPYFLSTSTVGKDVLHKEWLQIVTNDGESEVFRIYWSFDKARTLEKHFTDAVNIGVNVSYRIVDTNSSNTETLISGIWRFSHDAGNMTTMFAAPSTTCCLSKDDGLWGGKTGIIDGDVYPIDTANFWGIGNFDGSDSACSRIYKSGSILQTSSTSKTYMYYEYTTDPTMIPTTYPTIVPTTDPTMVPTADPTAKPTLSPTADPTSDPTLSPTVVPTFVPTADPTANPTLSPTVVPTPVPTADPTADPTLSPSMAPTPAPSTFSPTRSPVQEQTKLSVSQNIYGISYSVYQTNQAVYDSVLQQTIVDSVPGTSLADIEDFQISSGTSRRILTEHRHLRSSAHITAQYVLGLASNDQAYTELRAQLEDAVQTGLCDTSLQENAMAYNATVFNNATCGEVNTLDLSTYNNNDDDDLILPISAIICIGVTGTAFLIILIILLFSGVKKLNKYLQIKTEEISKNNHQEIAVSSIE